MSQNEGSNNSPSLQHSEGRYNNSPTNDVDTLFEGTTPPHTELQQDMEPKVFVPSPTPRKLRVFGLLARVHIPEHLRPSLRLQNSGSVARDHLASERTFLAYVRTSLAMASVGVAIIQLFTVSDLTMPSQTTLVPPVTMRMKEIARPVGASMVLLGIIIVIIAFFRYFTVQKALIRGFFPAARTYIVFLSFSLTVIVTAVFGSLVHSFREAKKISVE